MTSKELRKCDSLQSYAERICSCRSSGLTVQDWCLQNGVDKSTYYRWEKSVLEAASEGLVVRKSECQEVQFAEINLHEMKEPFPVKKEPVARATVANLRYGPLTLEVYSGADAVTLSALMKAMNLC